MTNRTAYDLASDADIIAVFLVMFVVHTTKWVRA